MSNAWLTAEWKELCRRLRLRALRCNSEGMAAIDRFCDQEQPGSYLDFLNAVRMAADLVGSLPKAEPLQELNAGRAEAQQHREDRGLERPSHGYDIVDEVGYESFPASDPPAWTGAVTPSATVEMDKRSKRSTPK